MKPEKIFHFFCSTVSMSLTNSHWDEIVDNYSTDECIPVVYVDGDGDGDGGGDDDDMNADWTVHLLYLD